MKPILKKKQCEVGYSCGGACIEKADDCRTEISNESLLNKFAEARAASGRSGYFNQVEQLAYDEITSQMSELFGSPEADELFKKSAASYDSKDNVRLTGDIRHQFESASGKSYDRILDNVRAASQLDPGSWNKVYNKSKNNVEGILVKRLLESKGNC